MAPRKKHIPEDKKKKPGAKPIKFDLKQVELLASQGLTQEQVALCLGISARTVSDRLANDAEFADAYKKGEAQGILQVSNALFKEAVNPDNKNPASRIFFLKTRAKWTERIELTGKDGAALSSALTPDEKVKRAREMLQEVADADAEGGKD